MPRSSAEHVGAGLYFFSFPLEFFIIFIPSYSNFLSLHFPYGVSDFFLRKLPGATFRGGL
jgi:hypothetical protein